MLLRFAWMLALATLGAAGESAWTQWGGPHGDFTVEMKAPPKAWGASGPKVAWKRALGEGYSGIVTDGATLYTMLRRGNQEVAVALDAATGKTRWEFPYDAAFRPGMAMENGPGPHATPLLLGDRVFTIGVMARMHAIDRKTGRPVWWKDLYKDFPGSTQMDRGYSPSPIAYKNTVIVKLGGPNHAIVALSPKDGSLEWQKHGFTNSPCTPAVIQVDGQEQLVTMFSAEAVGMDPNNGNLLWSYPHKTEWGLNIATPLWGAGNLLFLSSAYNGGARALRLRQSGGKTAVEQVWASNRMRIHHGNAVRIGDFVYASSGDFGPAPLTAIDIRSGQVAWQDRAFGKANLLLAGGTALVLDEHGTLALTTLGPKGLQVHAKAPLLSHKAWTAPIVAGSRLYARDRSEIVALDLQ